MRLLNSTASVGSSWTYTHVHVCVLYTVYITRNQLDSVELHICVKHMSFYCGEGTATPLPETLHDLSRRLTRLGGGDVVCRVSSMWIGYNKWNTDMLNERNNKPGL